MTILDRIVEYKRTQEIPDRMRQKSLAELKAQAADVPPALDMAARLKTVPGVSLIAEVKKASPSKGLLRPNFDPLELAEMYAANGAAAISVLTDEPYFQGSLAYIKHIRQRVTDVPLLRKDFIIHPYQVYEARAAQADALLLIAAVLEKQQMSDLLSLSRSLGMEALIEVHNQEELEGTLTLNPKLVGVNNRNLHDFSVDLNICLGLRPLVPVEICFVAESGIHTRADMMRLSAAGVDAALVGEALVTAADVGAKVRSLLNDDQS